MKLLVACVLLVLSAVGCQTPTEPGRQTAQAFSTRITKQVTLNYLLYLPPDYKESRQKWPTILYLHNAGDRGDDIEFVKRNGPPRLIAAGREFPFIVISPQCPLEQSWDPDALLRLLDEVEERYRIDRDRIFVTGSSMGGYGTWRLAMESPGRFAAIAPMCGGGNAARVSRIAHLPAWVFHGAKDGSVVLSESEQLVIGLRQYGSPVKFTVYPDVGHDCWTRTYQMPELYDWFLQQRRAVSVKPATKVNVPREPIAIEAESMQVIGPATVPLEGASDGKALRFEAEKDSAETTLTLPAGAYELEIYELCMDGEHDSATIEIGERSWIFWNNDYGHLSKSPMAIRFVQEQSGPVTVRLKRREPGVLIDRLVFVPLY